MTSLGEDCGGRMFARVHGVPPYESESVAEGFEVGGGLL